MSAVWSSEAPRAEGGRYRSDLEGHAEGNGSEQWDYHERSTMASTVGNGGSQSAADASRGSDDISVTQKMISACWGSLLTSLLGTYTVFPALPMSELAKVWWILMNWCSHSPGCRPRPPPIPISNDQ